MEPNELLGRVVQHLDALDIPYFVTGSMGSIVYGEPRFTTDIDIVIQADPMRASQLAESFDPLEYYASSQAAAEAAARAGQFNVIHPASGLKVDFMIATRSAYNDSRFARMRDLAVLPGRLVHFAAPEDIIIKKLEYYKEGRSSKHLRDIRGILGVLAETIDRDYIAQWVAKLQLASQWEEVIRGSP